MLGKGYKVSITTAAEQDLEAAFVYYSGLSASLGVGFIQVFDSKSEALERFWAYELLQHNLRKVRLSPFPYHLYFKIEDENKIIRIVGVKHERMVLNLNS
jgi:mRNA-degrading endonuclease RelE of RelBE toxin-antitoxin system